MIAVEAVTKNYGAFTAVDDVSFTAEAGRVTGFLGPNGAGKSTTMRILVGLPRATSGIATVSGRQSVDLPNPGLEVGVLLDAFAQHAGRTGREILTIAQQYLGLPKQRVAEMLEVVSLTPAESSRRVGNYSLGIATALIGDPQVLILDEDELLHAAGTHVRAADLGELELALIAAGLTATPAGDGALSTDADATLVGQIALEARIVLTELRPAESSGPEDMFLKLTAGSQHEGPASPEEAVVPS